MDAKAQLVVVASPSRARQPPPPGRAEPVSPARMGPLVGALAAGASGAGVARRRGLGWAGLGWGWAVLGAGRGTAGAPGVWPLAVLSVGWVGQKGWTTAACTSRPPSRGILTPRVQLNSQDPEPSVSDFIKKNRLWSLALPGHLRIHQGPVKCL
jgi:hypothetical protein